jgi:hypothetical protein
MDDRELSTREIHDLVARWMGESKHLFVALPALLAKLEQPHAEMVQLRARIVDLELENAKLRLSRAEIAETFARLQELMAKTVLEDTHPSLEPLRTDPGLPELSTFELPALPPEPDEPFHLVTLDFDPEPETSADPVSVEPAPPQSEPVEAMSQTASEPASPPAAEPPASAEPAHPASPEPTHPKTRWPAPHPPSGPVRFSTALRPPPRKA